MQVLKDSLRFSRAIFIVGDLSSCDAFLLNSVNIFGTEPSRGVFVLIFTTLSVVAQFEYDQAVYLRGSLSMALRKSPVRFM